MQAEDLNLLVTRQMPFGKYKGRLLALMLELDHNGLAHLLTPLRRPGPTVAL